MITDEQIDKFLNSIRIDTSSITDEEISRILETIPEEDLKEILTEMPELQIVFRRFQPGTQDIFHKY